MLRTFNSNYCCGKYHDYLKCTYFVSFLMTIIPTVRQLLTITDNYCDVLNYSEYCQFEYQSLKVRVMIITYHKQALFLGISAG